MATQSALARRYMEVTIGNLIEDVQSAAGRVCERAYELAAERGFAVGHDLDDWLKAVSELFFVPPSEFSETKTAYTVKASVSGFEPEQITVSVEPQYVTILGKAADAGSEASRSKELFCQYRLPHPVVAGNATAVYDSGELTVTLPKQSEPLEADIERPVAA
ncbi:MAG: Hsp20 family protein [Bryobacterales bacterium]|nr:Hsp20 family protein [Bryobacterales bacterium]